MFGVCYCLVLQELTGDEVVTPTSAFCRQVCVKPLQLAKGGTHDVSDSHAFKLGESGLRL